MDEPVKKRSYEASRRQAASAATRQRIIDAGRELILTRGYRATTIAAVAAKAEVNVDTIYQLVGRKPLLLRELIEQAISGQDHAVTAEDRAHVQAIRAEPDPATKLALYARAIRETHRGWLPCSWRYATPPRPSRKQRRSGARSANGGRPTCASSSVTSTTPTACGPTSPSTTLPTPCGS